MRACSGRAYRLEQLGESLWLLSLLGILGGSVVFLVLGIFVSWHYWWIPVLSLCMGIISMFMRGSAERILQSMEYRYDYELDKAFLKGEEIKLS